ncbi:SDR family NAD(P)-dependent oxidoreductase [Dermacoccus sp. 147Ba]|uniref:SDR family NAD(P)-dependent oxidoreductase n=1 Tax=Dermacoccus sp. 147Ba TaxID=2510111 RepID=UPI00101BC450|nr:SDR family NAD(P)-dependent oxidoreductase [Dermacoccus sp. 147Ba]RYI21661.1 SDR family NAD(P)-dependent oxidoreductase [Dermacoccus sp. 147Ba]
MNITQNTVALVTGGGSGLGEATARRLHDAGAGVVIVDLPSSKGEALAAELGERARFVATDVRDEAQVQAAVTAATELGELRITVSCAGVATPGRILGRKGVHALEQYKTVIDINLVGTFNVLRLSAEAMAKNEPVDGDRGVVVMTASAAAYDGQIGQAAYASSKGGVVGLTLPAARDLADLGVRVMTIAPGTMETPMLAGLPEAAREALGQAVPHPSRLGRPDEYASLVAHIVDNGLLNGEVIRLDGALRMPPK